MKKNIYIAKKSVYPNLLRNEEIKIYFIIYSNNKEVEKLIFILNKLFFNNKIEKIKETNSTTFFSVNTPIKNYFVLKENLNFKIKEESLKFEFVSIKFKNNNLSVDFFEKNYLSSIDKEELIEDLVYLSCLNFLTNKNFLIKFFLLVIFIIIKFSNSLKDCILKKV